MYNYHKGLDKPLRYVVPGLRVFYSHMRHAGPTCLLILLWVHPIMTADRMLLAVILTIFMTCAHKVTDVDYEFAQTYFAIETTTTTTTYVSYDED